MKDEPLSSKPPGGGEPTKPKRKPRKPPVKKKPDPDIGKTVWISCRAKRSCTGNESQISMKFRLPGGGTSIRYKCLKCKGAFHITI